jgi:hypothetical protein
MNFKEDKQAAETALQYEKNKATYKVWLQSHPEVTDCTANELMLQEYLDWTDDFTAADLDFALGNLAGRLQLAIQRIPTPAEVKNSLISKIGKLTGASAAGTTFKLAVDGGKRVVVWTTAQLSQFSASQLTELLEELVRKQTLNAMSASELQKIVVEGRTYVGYPQLGKTVVRAGTIRAVVLDAAYLKSLDVWELKKYTRLYGVEQINARLAGRD